MGTGIMVCCLNGSGKALTETGGNAIGQKYKHNNGFEGK